MWTSCTKGVLRYPEMSMVQIYPELSDKQALPTLDYYFYSTDQDFFRLSSNALGYFEGNIPYGTYRVIATNTAANEGNVVFNNIRNYDEATVSVDSSQLTVDSDDAASRSSRSTVNSQLSTVNSQRSTVYSVFVKELVATSNTQPYCPPTKVLTKRLELDFTLEDGLETEVKSITGVLPGVYSAVYLATGLPTTEATNQSPNTAVRFDVVGKGNKRKAQIGLFGLRDPERGTVYTNILELTLNTDNGYELVTIDLTEELSRILSKYGGSLPQEISADIKLTAVGPIQGSITGWESGGGDIIIIK
jgi:hypothetical protein